MTRTSLVDSAAAFSAASRTLGLFGRTITWSELTAVMRLEDLADRRVHRLPALDHDRRALAPQDLAVSAALGDGDERDLRWRRLRRRVELREPPLALGRLAVHVADLHARGVDDADRAPALRARPPARRCGRAPSRPTRRRCTSSESPSGSRLACRASRSIASPSTTNTVQYRYSDSSWWIDSCRDLLGHLGHVGKRLSVQRVEHASDELDQPRSAGVDDAGLAELVEHLGCPARRRRRPGRRPARDLRRPAARGPRGARPPRPSRG